MYSKQESFIRHTECKTQGIHFNTWYVRRSNHYNGGIETVVGLIHFLCDNPQAFSFDHMTEPRYLQKDWLSYRDKVYQSRDVDNEMREKKGMRPTVGPIFYHETEEGRQLELDRWFLFKSLVVYMYTNGTLFSPFPFFVFVAPGFVISPLSFFSSVASRFVII